MGRDGNETMEEAIKSFEKSVTCNNVDEVQAVYSGRAENYDQQEFNLGTKVQRESALVCLNHIGNSKSSSVLDVGSGTGAVAFHLRKDGNYEGVIDIMDGNMDMLCVASKKELNLRCIICHWIEDDLPLPENSYDAVTCIGSLLPNHLPIQSVKGMLKVVKRGGFVIFNLRDRRPGDDIYIAQMQDMMDEWTKDKLVELVEVKEVVHLKNVDDLLTQLYVYRKL